MPVEVAAAGIRALAPGLHLPVNSRLSAEAGPSSRAAVFLDRDGVLIQDFHYICSPSQIEFLPDVPGLLRSLQDRYYLVVFTNQSGIARGYFSEEDLLSIHSSIVQQLTAEGALIDAFYYCPHLSGCACRKPAPGLVLRAAADWGLDLARSAVIGDTPRDVEAGRSAGVPRTFLLDAEMTLAGAVESILGGAA